MPRTVGDFSPTDPTAIEVYSFDFTKRLAAGEMLLSSAWTMTVTSGIDPLPGNHLIGGSTITGSVSSQMIGGCIAAVTYTLFAQVTTSGGQTLPVYADLYCKAVVG